jgi:hypothetical protein
VTGIELVPTFDVLAPNFSVAVIDLKLILMLVISLAVEIRFSCHLVMRMLRVQVSSIHFILTLSENVD